MLPWTAPSKKPMNEAGRHGRPSRATNGAAFRRDRRSHRCWRISTCAGSCWGGRSSAWSEVSALAADDLVILCRRGNAEAALHHLREIMGKLQLTEIGRAHV